MEGEVIKIISPSAVGIDLGAAQGVKIGDKFIIYELGEMITHPRTKANLGCLEIVKATVTVTHIQDNFSVAESYKTEKRTIGLSPLASFLGQQVQETEVQVRQNIAAVEFDLMKASPVKEGDLVRHINSA